MTDCSPRVCPLPLLLAAGLILLASLPAAAGGFGPRLGLEDGDDFFLGAQGELGPVLGEANLVPGLDFRLGDSGTTTANVDLRWYLLPLPDTGLRFYGAAGPTLVLSPGTELGLSLSVGLNIPMQSNRRYNVEYRFGLGDIPESKVAVAVLF
ncbi:MAG: hypothetical protein IH621_10405 [Krumholzibacteria bacterium]|nr:hypothetical protein [Candidatus Krumholzibacteria bacterium]